MVHEPSAGPTTPRPFPKAGAWLALAILAWAAVVLALATLRLRELGVTTWDFGIYQQALWSAAHGGPFYEAADRETGGFGSFLQVHSAFLLYLLAPVYGAIPNPEVLLVVQTAVVALAAAPLYLLTRDLTGSPRRALLAAILFLIWAPLVASSLYDFHIEAFLPVELFTVALFYERGRYLAGLAVAAVAFATMEFAPVLTFFLAVFFGWPTESQSRSFLRALRGGPVASLRVVRSGLLDRRLQADLALAVTSVAAYYLLLHLRTDLLAANFGYPAFPTQSRGYVIGGSPSDLGLRASNLSVGFLTKVEVWLLAFALVGFLPLLAPRTFVVALPVAVFAAFSANLNYSSIGFQYGFLYAIPVFLGVAYALPRFTRQGFPRFFFRPPEPEAPPRVGWRRALRRPAPWVGALALVIVLNLAAGPLDPMLHGANGAGAGYRWTYKLPPGYDDARSVAALVPAHTTLVATDDLFPLVANSPNAYSFFWGANNYHLALPFSPTHLPGAVLVSQDRYYAVSPWLASLLYVPTEFGARAVAWTTPAGPVVLFLAGYHGPTETLGSAPPSSAQYGPGALVPGVTANVVPTAIGPYSTKIESESLNRGAVFAGPWGELAPGNYTFTVFVRAWAANLTTPPSLQTNVLFLNGDAFGTAEFLSKGIAFGTISSVGWTGVSFPVVAVGPLFNVEVRGYSSSTSAVVDVGYLTIVPAP